MKLVRVHLMAPTRAHVALELYSSEYFSIDCNIFKNDCKCFFDIFSMSYVRVFLILAYKCLVLSYLLMHYFIEFTINFAYENHWKVTETFGVITVDCFPVDVFLKVNFTWQIINAYLTWYNSMTFHRVTLEEVSLKTYYLLQEILNYLVCIIFIFIDGIYTNRDISK